MLVYLRVLTVLDKDAGVVEAQRKTVVELGTGCGLVGLVLACLGARVLLTDLPHVLVTPLHRIAAKTYLSSLH